MLSATLALLASVTAGPPIDAVGLGLTECVAHPTTGNMISAANADKFDKMGMVYSPSPPTILRSAADTPYGHGTFGNIPTTSGSVWVVGYDSGVCLLFAIGTPLAESYDRLIKLFSIPNTWKAVEDHSAPPAQKARYVLRDQSGELTALVNRYDAGPGMLLVTIGSTAKVK